MDVDGDAFISYAHLDNLGLSESHKGWVANLQRALQIRVAQLLGKDARIWWDPKLRGNDVLSDTLVTQLQRVAALISVVSPRYIRSEWALRELDEFCKAAEHRGGVHIGDKSRLFKVLKTPVPIDQHPPELQALIGYEFFKLDSTTGRVRELDEIFGPEAQRDFWIKLDDLAHDICGVLQLLEQPENTALHGGESRTVFLADATTDLKPERDIVRRELQQLGFTVLPATATPLVMSELVESVRADLARSRLSIHMFGEHYSVVPEGGLASLLEIQNELAIERARDGRFGRLIWIPAGLQVNDERQRQVIDRLRTDHRTQDRVDVLESSLEEFQTVIGTWLKREDSPAAPRAGAVGPKRVAGQVYLVYDPRERETVAPWADLLFLDFEVVHPAFEGDETEIREYHEENLRTCDGVIIFYGAGNQVWLRRKLSEVQKSAAYGRAGARPEIAVCVIPPGTPDKEHFRTHLATVIRQDTGFAPGPIEPFVASLKSRAQGSAA
jgi:hypothetical protein